MRMNISMSIPKALPSLSQIHLYINYSNYQSNPYPKPRAHLAHHCSSSRRMQHPNYKYSMQQPIANLNSNQHLLPQFGTESHRCRSLPLIQLLGAAAAVLLSTVRTYHSSSSSLNTVTGENYEEDLVWVLIQSGISAFLYFILFPPVIMNWLRIRWYKRNLVEMYFQFLCVFLFFPGVLLWAPFLNFRKFPRDPSMKYPWSVPQNPSLIKGGFRKYPWAQPEDYE
ncbi:uncharacterized protein LOC127265801 isoform X3 [Andrographis paniculata]|uniref:uncharacterized protein LOC127265801 isoform X3 n=1 Tax=Andrographis paniculata TaxID=175694 RepID=UPI0021E848FC|nr:uncharacterized protein LOC127265801 isoform X3 [Andrographis paniculata]